MSYKVDWTTIEVIPANTFLPDTSLFLMTGNVYKMGRIIFGDLTISRTSGTYSNYFSHISTIPSDYRPRADLYPLCGLYADGTDLPASIALGHAKISTNGAVNLTAGPSTGKSVARIQFSYITA